MTQVHQVSQYKPMRCFTKFGQEVMAARREGDQDPTKRIISDSCKLMGKYSLIVLNHILSIYQSFTIASKNKSIVSKSVCQVV